MFQGEPRHGGVGFAVRSSLRKSLQSTPYGISTRVMTLQLCLEGGHLAAIISCYAPTLLVLQEEKDQFYEQLSLAITAVPHEHKLFVLGDFNARVGRDQSLWPKVIGRHGGRQGKCQWFIATPAVLHAEADNLEYSFSTGKQIQVYMDASSLTSLAPDRLRVRRGLTTGLSSARYSCQPRVPSDNMAGRRSRS